jgi:hypothetical protein
MTDGFPTGRRTHNAGYLCVLVWCKSCQHQAPADLQALIAMQVAATCLYCI